MMKTTLRSRSPIQRFGIAVALLAWINIASYWSTHPRWWPPFDAVAQAYQALGKFQHIEVLMEAAESSVRGYVISGETTGLDPYRYAKLVVPYELPPNFKDP